MNVFDELKNRVDMLSIAAEYGFSPNRHNYICCPFHSEKTPSMRLYSQSFYCFGCHIGGDVITFVSKLFDLTAIEAAKKLNTDFALSLDICQGAEIKPKEKIVSKSQIYSYFDDWQKWAFRVLNDYYKLLLLWYEDFAPKATDDIPYPLWVKACRELPLIDHYCMILIQGSDETRKRFFIDHRKEVEQIADEYRKYIGD